MKFRTANNCFWKLVVFIFQLTLFSCNEEYPNILESEYSEPTPNTSKSKVLYVILEGVNGNELKTLAPQNLTEMTVNSLYTYDGLSELSGSSVDNVLGWSNLLIGNYSTKHGANGTGVLPSLSNNPTVLKRVLGSQLITSSPSFYSIFSEEATDAFLEVDDEATVLKSLDLVQNSSSDLIAVQLNAAEIAGQNNGYTLANPAYEQALITLDEQIGRLKNEVYSRDGISKENWLIVVVSNKGGNVPAIIPNNHFFNPAKNMFMMYYSPKFASRLYVKPNTQIPFTKNVARFNLSIASPTRAVVADANQFKIPMPNVGDGMTVELKIKISGNGTSSSWPEIISKGLTRDSAPNGWVINSPSGTALYQIRVIGERITAPVDGVNMGDGIWHTITMTVKRVTSTHIQFSRYFDGQLYGTSANVALASNVALGQNDQPLTIGIKSTTNISGTPSMEVSNVLIYNKPLESIVIANNFCKTEIDNTHPNFNDLIGWWAFDNASGLVVPNRVAGAPASQSFVMSNNNTLAQTNVYSPHLCPPLLDSYFRVLPFSVDAPFVISNWLKLPFSVINAMEGQSWPFIYTNN